MNSRVKPATAWWRRTKLVLLPLLLLAVGCASGRSGKKPPDLIPYVNDYNNMIRWGQPEKAAPYVEPEIYPEFRKWAKETGEKYAFQEWSMEAITYETETTATIVIERRGYEVPKYIEKEFPAVQSWTFIKGLGWRILSGF